MAFHFPLMPRLFMALHQEDRFPIHDIMAQTPAIPENCQWCLFLRNHDELTLEMVTDEERDYMYRAYARDRHARINLGIRHRLAPLLRNDRRRIELMLPCCSRCRARPSSITATRSAWVTTSTWAIATASARRCSGRPTATPASAGPTRRSSSCRSSSTPRYHYETVNVEAQQGNPSSLLWWIKRLITLRKTFRAFGRGIVPAAAALRTPKVLAFVREYRG